MKIAERIALLKAGYTKAEINSMIDEDAQTVSEPVQDAEESKPEEGVMKVLSAMASEIKDLKTAMYKENIANSTVQIGGQPTAEDILASLINPPGKEK